MRFELSVALKYLIPRWRNLSVSLISLISVLVISLVVWLVILFLSVTEGIEKKWIHELVALNAPVKMTPTEAYYDSYYYLIDRFSSASNFSTKSIGEKLLALQSDPYDPLSDQELPRNFPQKDLSPDGRLVDPIKEGWSIIATIHETKVRPQEYETTFGNLRLDLHRESQDAYLNQVCYIASLDQENENLKNMILPPLLADEKRWIHQENGKYVLPSHEESDGILVSKHFQKNGVELGDKGFLSYYSPTATSLHEQRIPIYIAGFYDPGVLPVGSKLLFVDTKIASLFSQNGALNDAMLGNGINLWFNELNKSELIKEKIIDLLEKKGIKKYWDVQSFRDYEFSRPLLEQLQSDKNLFTLIAIIILIVACSNIISMLILLVNDKKKEIGILQSMGASPLKIGTIFGICGVTLGIISSVVGIAIAYVTLKNLQSLVNFLSFIQGRDLFQAAFFGSQLPSQISLGSLLFVTIATLIISLLAGTIPAIKAAKIRPSDILRGE